MTDRSKVTKVTGESQSENQSSWKVLSPPPEPEFSVPEWVKKRTMRRLTIKLLTIVIGRCQQLRRYLSELPDNDTGTTQCKG